MFSFFKENSAINDSQVNIVAWIDKGFESVQHIQTIDHPSWGINRVGIDSNAVNLSLYTQQSFVDVTLSKLQYDTSFVDFLSVGLNCHVYTMLVGDLEQAIDSVEVNMINGAILGLGEVSNDTLLICATSLTSLVRSSDSILEEIIMNGLDDQFIHCSLFSD